MGNELIVSVQNRIQEMQHGEGLRLPTGYSVGNALNSAYLILSDNSKGKSLLEKCHPTSVSKALLNMAIQGLSPAKNQCYFVPYGDQCTLMRSYFGSVSILERLSNVKKVHAEVIFEGDEFEIGSEDGRTVVTNFKPSFLNRDNPIIGAFAWVEQTDGIKVYTIMTKKEIYKSWSKAKTKKVQNDYPQEMAKRTVLSRAAKMFINSSSDNDLLVKAINETTEDEYDNNQPRKDITPNPPNIEKLEKSIFNQDENKKIAQDMIDSIDLNQADKDLQEELNIEFPDPSKNYLATGEVNGDVENEDGPYPF
ncbi:DNA recombination protein RecT [Enterococcus faecalis]|nr:DNA recombination protein RecT [Enterococcus faecalis]